MAILNFLDPAEARIFRITHRANVPWILDHGLHCQSAGTLDPAFVSIGSTDLIGKRRVRNVPQPPGGVLSDYVPFYFTPLSPMLLNIKTGRNAPQRRNEEIVILASSLHELRVHGVPFLFTDGHAYLAGTQYFADAALLHSIIDWDILQRHDFANDAEDPGKQNRYQAEALAHRHVPVSALLRLACYNDVVAAAVQAQVDARRLSVQVAVRPKWYF